MSLLDYLSTASQGELPRPTVEGMATGIVDVDPIVLQCGDCGLTLTQPDGQGVGFFIILSGWHFHTCEKGGPRRCRECLRDVVSDCPNRRCKE